MTTGRSAAPPATADAVREGPPREPVNPVPEARSVDPAPGAAPSRTVSDGVFAAAQAEAGRQVYAASCAACHGGTFTPAAR